MFGLLHAGGGRRTARGDCGPVEEWHADRQSELVAPVRSVEQLIDAVLLILEVAGKRDRRLLVGVGERHEPLRRFALLSECPDVGADRQRFFELRRRG